MSKYYKVTAENGVVTEVQRMTRREYNLATSKDTVKWFKDVFRGTKAKEIETEYGWKSVGPDGVTASLRIINLDYAPKYVYKAIEAFEAAQSKEEK